MIYNNYFGEQEVHWGPVNIAEASNACSYTWSSRCYLFKDMALLRYYKRILSSERGEVNYPSAPISSVYQDSLSTAFRIEITALDSTFKKYLEANDPFGYGADLLLDRKRVSNISGEHLGLFVARNSAYRYTSLSECSKYLLGFISSLPPGDNCQN